MSDISNMSLYMSMEKDERKFRMRSEISKGKTLTVKSCQSSLNLSKPTILKYLKEINMSIYDPEIEEMTKVYNDDTEIIYPF